MGQYRHHVSGFFIYQEDAETARSRLFAQGIPPAQVHLFTADSAPPEEAPPAESNKVLTSVIKDGVIGTAVGLGVGALTEVTLVATSVSLFVANPLIPTLALLGWGAGLGGILGAVFGASNYIEENQSKKEGKLSALIQDAVLSGQIVLVAETRSKTETEIARKIIEEAIGEFQDIKEKHLKPLPPEENPRQFIRPAK